MNVNGSMIGLKRRGKRTERGIAYVMALVIVLVLFMIFFAMNRFTSNEMRLFGRILNLKKAEYLVRTGLNIAEDRLQQERWYGADAPSGTLEPDLPERSAYIKIYADDYILSKDVKLVEIGENGYVLLDHVKVYVYAKYKDRLLYGYGKYIISPEPIYDGTSTKGLDPENPDQIAARTFRRMINVKILTEEEILDNVPGFAGLDDRESRRKLGEYLAELQHDFVKNYARNKQLSENISDHLVISEEKLPKDKMHDYIANLDSLSSAGGDLNALKNQFIRDNFSRFFMSTGWDISPEEKEDNLADIDIDLGPAPERTSDGEKIRAIRVVYGAPHPIRVPPARPRFGYSRDNSAGEKYLDYIQDRGDGADPSDTPRDYVESVSRTLTSYKYGIKWNCDEVLDVDPISGDITEVNEGVGTGNNSAGVFLYFYDNKDASPPVCTNLEYHAAINPPAPAHTNYYMKDQDSGTEMAVSTAMNFFLKYVDETYVFMPNGKGESESWWKLFVLPGPPTPAWGVVTDNF